MIHAIEKRAREALASALRNAHAMERQAIAVLDAQTSRLDGYPVVQERIHRHIGESREQAERIEGMLDQLDKSRSPLKEAFMSFIGVAQSSIQAMADDAVLRAIMADFMLEHLEIAAYRSLIELVHMAGRDDFVADLEKSLLEEEEMAIFLEEQLPVVTRRYVELSADTEDDDAVDPADASERAVGANRRGPSAAAYDVALVPGAAGAMAAATQPREHGFDELAADRGVPDSQLADTPLTADRIGHSR